MPPTARAAQIIETATIHGSSETSGGSGMAVSGSSPDPGSALGEGDAAGGSLGSGVGVGVGVGLGGPAATAIVNVATFEMAATVGTAVPSSAEKVKLSVPLKSGSGV